MESTTDKPPLIVIVGETGSGKSELAIELAERFNGEIISADSRTLYRGIDIGTAKPTLKQRSRIPHHLIDITSLDKPITVSEYRDLALKSIDDIYSRGKIPFLVGGTGLYVDSIIYGFSFSGPAKPDLRQELQKLTVEQLQELLISKGVPLPENLKNSRHLIRQIETGGVSTSNHVLRANTLILGLHADREILAKRLAIRIQNMLDQGLETEAKGLLQEYGPNSLLAETIGYQEFIPYFNGESSLQNVYSQLLQNTLRYAKRQRTWFRRYKQIVYICKKDDAVDLITTFLNKVTVA